MDNETVLKLAEEIRRDPLRFERYRVGAGAPMFHADTSREKILRAGNQWGKTRAGARETLWIMTGDHPWREVRPPPVRGRVVTYSWAQSVEVQRRINEILPKFIVEGYDFNDQRGFVGSKLKLKNGSLLEITTASQGTLAHAGAALDFVWIDEPPPRDIYSELIARCLVKKGTLYLTMTPVGRPVDWLIDEIDEGRLSGHRFDLTTDNCPHLDESQIAAIAEKYLPHERPQRMHGHWHGESPDRFFEGFSQRSVSDELPRGEVKIALGIDHGEGIGKEAAILMLYTEGDYPKIWILDEYNNTKRTDPDEDAAGILEMLARHDIRPQEVDLAVGDINSLGKGGGGIKVNDALAEAIRRQTKTKHLPIVIRSARKGRGSVMYGSRLINYAFRRADLTIHPRCKNLIHSFQHFKGSEEDLKHNLDAARYAISSILMERKGYFRLRFDSSGEITNYGR
jgi:phage terminase large subunit-like protein